MGSCFSTDGGHTLIFPSSPNPSARSPSSSSPPRRPPSRVVDVRDGSLKEFASPVTAADVLSRYASRLSHFICASDGLRVGSVAAALGHDDQLPSDMLYYVLPIAMLGRELTGADMAGIAARGSAALASAVPKSPHRSPGPARRRDGGSPDHRRRYPRSIWITKRISPAAASGWSSLNGVAMMHGGDENNFPQDVSAPIPRRKEPLDVKKRSRSSSSASRRSVQRRMLSTIEEVDAELC